MNALTTIRVWTLTVEGDKGPCAWLTHQGPQSVAAIDDAVRRATENGYTVIVGCEPARRTR